MQFTTRKLLLLATLATLCGIIYGETITVKDLKLYVDCEEFVIKGMAYNPVPLGIQSMKSDLTEGAGFCSPKRTPFGEWKSACFDSDYFDGSSDVPDRDPAGPAVGWFQAVWERDFPVMQELGVNTLRLYNSNPTTRQASIEQLGTNGIAEALGKNHIPFMDMAQQYGFKVIYPLVGDQTILTTSTDETIKQFLRNQIDEVGNHSALIMWNFSNELPLDTDASLLALINKYIPYIREYTFQKWNRFVPITVAVVDIPSSYDMLVETLDVDVFSTNAGYRGVDFQDLWSGDRTPGFSGFSNLSRNYDVPVLISEIGWHQLNNTVTYAIPDWSNQIWADLVKHIDQGCIGGVFFEFSDEPYSKVDPLQQTMGVVAYAPSTDSNGKSSLEPNVWTPDTLIKKDIIFDALKSGTFEGKEYNFNGDVFDLIGRQKSTLAADQCVQNPPPSTTSGSTSGSTTGSVSTSGGSTTGTPQTPSTTGTQNFEENSATSVGVSVAMMVGAAVLLL